MLQDSDFFKRLAKIAQIQGVQPETLIPEVMEQGLRNLERGILHRQKVHGCKAENLAFMRKNPELPNKELSKCLGLALQTIKNYRALIRKENGASLRKRILIAETHREEVVVH